MPDDLGLELASLLPITQKMSMPTDFTFTKLFNYTKARASTKVVLQPPLPYDQHIWTWTQYVIFLIIITHDPCEAAINFLIL